MTNSWLNDFTHQIPKNENHHQYPLNNPLNRSYRSNQTGKLPSLLKGKRRHFLKHIKSHRRLETFIRLQLPDIRRVERTHFGRKQGLCFYSKRRYGIQATELYAAGFHSHNLRAMVHIRKDHNNYTTTKYSLTRRQVPLLASRQQK